MSELLWAGVYAGGGAGVLMILASHMTPRFAAGNFIRDNQEIHVFGFDITRREAHFLGVLLHLLFCLAAGLGFAYGVEHGWIGGFNLLPMLAWSICLLLFSACVIMPLEGHGFFGLKHDPWFPLDALLTNLLWGVLYLLLIRLWI